MRRPPSAWAHENRTAAIRVPSGPPKARRIEHRVAGGDVNPYLMLTAILGAALNGIEDAVEPPAPIKGNSYDQELPQMIDGWQQAIDVFEASAPVARIFPAELIRNLVMTKRQELREMTRDELGRAARHLSGGGLSLPLRRLLAYLAAQPAAHPSGGLVHRTTPPYP